MILLLAGLTGFVVGAVLAMCLDRLCPHLSKHHVAGPCDSPRCSGLGWTGVLSYATTQGHFSRGRYHWARRW